MSLDYPGLGGRLCPLPTHRGTQGTQCCSSHGSDIERLVPSHVNSSLWAQSCPLIFQHLLQGQTFNRESTNAYLMMEHRFYF